MTFTFCSSYIRTTNRMKSKENVRSERKYLTHHKRKNVNCFMKTVANENKYVSFILTLTNISSNTYMNLLPVLTNLITVSKYHVEQRIFAN